MLSRRAMLTGGAGLIALGTGGTVLALGLGSRRYQDYAERIRAPLGADPPLVELVRHATLAANGHNTQPWVFRLSGDRISIRPDFSRRTPAVDPDDHHLYVSLGCALENLVIAAASADRVAEVAVVDEGQNGVAVTLSRGAPSDERLKEMAPAIPLRQSTRSVYDGRPVAPGDLESLAKSAAVAGVDTVLVTQRSQVDRVRDLVIAGNDVQMADRAFIRELKDWLRFSPYVAMHRGDGLYSPASGNPALPEWLGPVAFDLAFRPGSEADKYKRHMDSSAGVAVFSAAAEGPAGWIAVGRACQRFCLMATVLGLRTAFVNQPVEVAALRGDLSVLAGLGGRRPDIVLRFGYAPAMTYSPRRPVEAVIEV
ncbi:Acg family FMN-binding oxidoreductase [Rhizobium cremeum]|uniref:Acg family FMN-binding oxidoreductase n=1 Tax=Rhizobium cremeum TaxID=2813827 RepID=UPI0039DF72AD